MTETLRDTLKNVISEENNDLAKNEKKIELKIWKDLKFTLREAGIILKQSSEELIRIRDLGMMACGIVENPTLPRKDAYRQLLIILEKYELPTTKEHRRKKLTAETRKITMINQIKELFPYDKS